MQDIGGTGEQQTQGIGQEGGRRGAIAVAVRLDRLESVFAIPAGAIEVFVGFCRKFCSEGHDGVVAPVCAEIKRRESRTVRPQ